MAQGDNEDNSARRHIEEFNAWLARMETMNEEELMEYAKEYKDMFNTQMVEAFKKLQQKKQQQPKRKKKRTAPSPIMGAVLKFHKADNDTIPHPGGSPSAC
ncbi:hypothetical protein VPH35_124454 [Triticum aestivum]